MTIGAYTASKNRVRFMAFSHSYIQNAFIYVFMRPRNYSSSMWAIIAPFEPTIWFSIALILITSILVILLTKWLPKRHRHFIIGGQMNRTPILNMFHALMGSAIPNPKMEYIRYFGVFARTLTILWILFWLVVRSSYEGSLFKFLQSRRISSPYDSVMKVQNSNVTVHIMKTASGLISADFDQSRYFCIYKIIRENNQNLRNFFM